MNRFFAFAALVLVVIVPILLQPSAAKEQEVEEPSPRLFTRSMVETMTEAHRQSHRDNFRPVSLFLPYYLIAPGVETSVSVLNRFSDSFVVRLTAFASQGEALSPIELEIAGGSQKTISLNEIFFESGSAFGNGSIRIDYLGEERLLDAWAVVRTVSHAISIPFADPARVRSTTTRSFWDTRPFARTGEIEPVPGVRSAMEVFGSTTWVKSGCLTPGPSCERYPMPFRSHLPTQPGFGRRQPGLFGIHGHSRGQGRSSPCMSF